MATVTAVLVARNGAQYLPATLAALAAQTRAPDHLIAVDAGSSDKSMAILAERLEGGMVASARRGTLAQTVNTVLLGDAKQVGDADWYWFLGHDNAPHPRALEALLGAVEIAPSVVVAGPKLMRWDDASVILGYGETMTESGASVPLVSGELDQSQHDSRTDVLGVAVPGMLVKADLWHRLGGFDDGLPSVDAGLDLGVRARLAGHRVERVPAAKVAAAGQVELFGRKGLGSGARNRIRRQARIHRALVYSPGAFVPLIWIGILPLAIGRALWQILAKRPGLAPGELFAGVLALVDTTVLRARIALRRAKRVGWAAISPLRATGREARELHERVIAVESRTADQMLEEVERPAFFSAGGAWSALLAAVAAFAVFGRLIGAPAIAGGALAPLGPVGQLWDGLGVQWRVTGGVDASDPFHALLALLGSATWWSPSLAVVLLTIAAMPLAAIGAWFAAARLARRGWGPTLAAIGWAVAPPLLAGLGEGQLGAVTAHVLLPWLVLAILDARRSWAMAAVAALLFAAVTASAPVLAPGLVLLLVLLMIVQPHRLYRLVITVVPAAALAAPLVLQQIGRGNPLGLLADPGVPVVREAPRTVAMLLGSPTADYAGWYDWLSGIPFLADVPGPLALAILVGPLGLLAVLALFLRGGTRAIPSLVIAAVGLVTAVGAAGLGIMLVDGEVAAVWSGSGLSLYWLGLLGAATVALDGLGRFAIAPALVAILGLGLAAVPLGIAGGTGATPVQPSNGRVLPALVVAEAEAEPGIGTLVMTMRGDDAVAVELERGAGPTLDRVLTLQTTRATIDEDETSLAELVGNLVSATGMDLATPLDDLGVRFLLLRADGPEVPAYLRAVDAIGGNGLFRAVGQTTEGFLWERVEMAPPPSETGPGTWQTPLGWTSSVVQIAVFAFFILLAVPTTRRWRARAARGGDADPFDDEGGDAS
jgi:GT2 family glycosyltransferase